MANVDVDSESVCLWGIRPSVQSIRCRWLCVVHYLKLVDVEFVLGATHGAEMFATDGTARGSSASGTPRFLHHHINACTVCTRDGTSLKDCSPGLSVHDLGGILMLYAFGSNGSCQLGLGPGVDDPSAPQEVKGFRFTLEYINHFTAGGNHTLIVDAFGHVLGAGNDEDGRCGHVTTDYQTQPYFTSFTTPQSIKQAAATWSTSAVLDGQGRHVWTIGTGNSGELGLGRETARTVDWQSLPDFPPSATTIVQLTSCMAHMVAVLSNGEVYGWGKGRKGQLGLPAEDVWSPRKIQNIPFAVVRAVCGKDFTCVFGDPAQGQTLVLGVGSNDRFGLRANAPSAVPHWKDVAASWGSIYILKDSGELIAWGRDDHGQLPPPGLPLIETISAGSEHCLALTKTGDVLAWGWGEHGNCGEPTDANGDVKGWWNVISVPLPARSLFAGCATSFIVTDEESQQTCDTR